MNNEVIISNCKSVKAGLFKNNNEISKVTICEGVTTIEQYAFYGCSRLKQITIPESILYIDDTAFDCSGVLFNIFRKKENNYILNRTVMVFCKENSYAELWFRTKKAGYIIVNN